MGHAIPTAIAIWVRIAAKIQIRMRIVRIPRSASKVAARAGLGMLVDHAKWTLIAAGAALYVAIACAHWAVVGLTGLAMRTTTVMDGAITTQTAYAV